MRRVRIAVAVALLVVPLAEGSALAGAHIKVEDGEYPGGKLKVIAKDCVSGKDYEAFVEVELVDVKAGNVRLEKDRKRADADGVTKLQVKIPNDATTYRRDKAIVTCRHLFDGGGSGVFYQSEEFFEVYQP